MRARHPRMRASSELEGQQALALRVATGGVRPGLQGLKARGPSHGRAPTLRTQRPGARSGASAGPARAPHGGRAELAFGISKIRPDERAQRLADGLEAWRSRFAGRIFAFTEEAALSYGELMGEAARSGRPMRAPGGRIAAIARVHSAPLATRNVADFRETGVVLVDPWRVGARGCVSTRSDPRAPPGRREEFCRPC